LSEQTHNARAQTFFSIVGAALTIVLDGQLQLTVPLTLEADIHRAATVVWKSVLEGVGDKFIHN
jgi:hypothetical protein